MVASNMNNIIKKKPSFSMDRSRKKSSEKCYPKNDSDKSGKRTINDKIFAMLLFHRTCFTILMLALLSPPVAFASSNDTEKVPQKESVLVKPEVNRHVYIPLEDRPAKPTAFREIHEQIDNKTVKTGNVLWDGLLNECMANPSIGCVQKNVYSYLDDSLGFSGDVNVTDGFRFKKNKLAYWKYSKDANGRENDANDASENEVDSENEETSRARFTESPIEEITDALYDKSAGFMMSHDLELELPEMIFNSATLKVSPRGYDGSGVLMHVDLLHKNEVNANGEGRIFFKKIKKFIKNKLLLAVIVVLIVIKLIKLKLFFILPLVLGVHNAKKLFLKLVLFVFPALSQIFKLCSWYHENYHQTKYHHHHHQIAHIHHPSFITHGGYPASGGHHSPIQSVEVHGGGYAPSLYQHEQPSWEFSGPGLGPEYLSADIHRNSVAFSPKLEDSNLINSWGLGPNTQTPNTAFTRPHTTYFDDQRYVRNTASGEIRNKATSPQGPPPNVRYQNHVNQQAEKDALVKAAQRQEEIKLAQQLLLRQQEEQKIALQHQLNQDVPPNVESVSTFNSQEANPVYDSFYSPILLKIDQIFAGLGVHEEPCRERLVCSMYKNPSKYSPHSNLLSNELSRDANELQKPSPGSTTAMRFFKYVQAARDGQDKNDCLQLYNNCAINYES